MPDAPEEWPAGGSPEDEGGPVKSFLEHLEDLRWVLIKSLVALGVAFVVCLVAGDKVVQALMFPLNKAHIRVPAESRVLTIMFGTNRLAAYELPPSQQEIMSALPTNRFLTLHLEPMPIGTNVFLGVRPESDPLEGRRLVITVGG